MLIQGISSLASSYMGANRGAGNRQSTSKTAANAAGNVSISETARALLASSTQPLTSNSSTQDVDKQLAAIKAKPGAERTQADMDYLTTHDERFVTLRDKMASSGFASLTSDEVDYMQKASGMVNTMAYLSSSEKALYDKMVSEGKGEAAQALGLVALSRVGMQGQQVTLPNGQRFDPTQTEVTAKNLRTLFSQMFVDPSGQTDRQFEALAAYLDKQGSSTSATQS